MDLPNGFRLRDATADDLPALAALRESVGWGVQDWALRAILEPPARCVVAVAARGEVAAVGSGISYGELGFVGNMIVAAEHRRRGLGAAILRAVMAFLAEAGCTRLELYATDAGRPLYVRHGFEPDGASAMATVGRGSIPEDDASVEVATAAPDDVDALSAYDAPRFGGDRGPLLRRMLADPDRPLLVARRDGRVAGYTWFRPEAARLGPFIADEPPVAAALVASAFATERSAEALTFNLPMTNEAGTAWLRSIGVALDPWDGRMGRGPRVMRRDGTIYGNVVGALG